MFKKTTLIYQVIHNLSISETSLGFDFLTAMVFKK